MRALLLATLLAACGARNARPTVPRVDPYAICQTPAGDAIPACDDYQRDARALVGGAE